MQSAMKNKEQFVIFLNNRYRKADNSFYLKLLKRKISIAADGGVRFFLKNRIKPDILIGDFDSAPRLSLKYLDGIEVIRYPARKDETDSQLAVKLALARGAKEIKICGALSVSEIDHTLSNIFLLELVKDFANKKKKTIKASIVNPTSEIRLAENETVTVTGRQGDFLSIIPLKKGSRISLQGMIYPAEKRTLKLGDTLSLRNQFRGKRGRIEVRGRVLVVTSKH